jgi:hypothetical protein
MNLESALEGVMIQTRRRSWNAVFGLAAFVLTGPPAAAEPPVLVDVAAPQADDAWESLQRSIDRAAKSGGTVRLAAGVYLVSKPIVLPTATTMVGAGMDRTTIRNLGRFPEPLVQFGRKGEVNRIALQDFCVEQRDNDLKGSNCIHGEEAHDVRLTRIRVRGSRYEGIIGGGHGRRWLLDECQAEDCGCGGPAYTMGVAGINVTSRDAVLVRCKTRRCGQGYEFGNLNVQLLYCTAEEPGQASPSIAFNCGSAVLGVSKVHLFRCTSEGYRDALICGNGIGRLSGVTVDSCTFVDGSITFSGGKPKNTVPTPDQGPDVSGSEIRDCVVRWTRPGAKTVSALLYNTGPHADGKVMGREPLLVRRLRVQFAAKPIGRVSDPVLGVAGHVAAPVVFRDCVIEGLDEPPVSGDGAVFGNNANAVPDDVSHIRFERCIATTSSGADRPFDVRLPSSKAGKKTSVRKELPPRKTKKR